MVKHKAKPNLAKIPPPTDEDIEGIIPKSIEELEAEKKAPVVQELPAQFDDIKKEIEFLKGELRNKDIDIMELKNRELEKELEGKEIIDSVPEEKVEPVAEKVEKEPEVAEVKEEPEPEQEVDVLATAKQIISRMEEIQFEHMKMLTVLRRLMEGQ